MYCIDASPYFRGEVGHCHQHFGKSKVRQVRSFSSVVAGFATSSACSVGSTYIQYFGAFLISKLHLRLLSHTINSISLIALFFLRGKYILYCFAQGVTAIKLK